MPAHTIVEHFDPFKNILSGFFPRGIAPMMHELRLQRMKEAFHDRIIPTVTPTAHTGGEAVVGQQLPVAPCGILDAAVGVMQVTSPRKTTAGHN